MKRRRPSVAAGMNSSEEENEEEGGDDGAGQAQFSPTRRQPRRQATPQSYRKLLGYDSSDTETQSVSSEKTKASGTQKTQSSGMNFRSTLKMIHSLDSSLFVFELRYVDLIMQNLFV